MEVLLAAVVGGLLTWLVALRSAEFGREAALAIWERDQQAKEEMLRRALLAELNENVSALTDPDLSHLRPIQRSAWDAARTLPMPSEVLARVSAAYVAGSAFNSALDRLSASIARDSNTRTQQDDLVAWAGQIRKDFVNARDEIRKLGLTWR